MIDFAIVSKLRALVIGDAIMDEYVYVQTVGKATKDNALSSMMLRNESFHGGAWAAAAHTRNLCAVADVMVGDRVMWNSRMVDATYLSKLFVTHEARPNDGPGLRDADIGSYDLVIVTDFGHGLMTPKLIERVSREAKFLAVNAQTNATNYGFNPVTKYPRADLVVIDKLEARVAARDRDSPLEDVIRSLGYPLVIVTLGSEGMIGYDGEFQRRPAMTDRVVDTMGAGDAVLAVVSPFAAVGTRLGRLLDVGNAAGAAKVGIIGHQQSVTIEHLKRFLS